MWLHHQNKLDTCAKYKQCSYKHSLKCRSPAICECVSHCLPICVATLPVLSSKNQILPNFDNLLNNQTA